MAQPPEGQNSFLPTRKSLLPTRKPHSLRERHQKQKKLQSCIMQKGDHKWRVKQNETNEKYAADKGAR